MSEAWRIIICARDAERIDNAVSVIVDALRKSTQNYGEIKGERKDREYDYLRQFTGKEIADFLKHHRDENVEYIERRMNKDAA